MDNNCCGNSLGIFSLNGFKSGILETMVTYIDTKVSKIII